MRLVPGDPMSLGGYWLAGRLGAGGRGVVYDAYDDEGRRFAVKVPRGEVDGQLSDAVWRVSPRHLARVVGVGMDGAVPYIVSEFVEGPDLRQAVERHGPYAGGELAALAAGMATALRSLHAVGIAHRDLRPENVLLSPDGPAVIDLGVTVPGTVGTRTYLAPEVFTGQRPGSGADVFAWGGVMLFAATGHDPFRGESLGGVMHRLLAVDPDLDALPEPLRSLVGRALAKNPQDRPSSEELLAGTERAEGGDGHVLAPPEGLAGPPSLGEVAERVYASLTPLQRDETPGLLLRLLDGDAVRRDEHGILDRLTEAGLLVRPSVAVPPVPAEAGTLVAVSGECVEPASAALARAWPRLRAWEAGRSLAPGGPAGGDTAAVASGRGGQPRLAASPGFTASPDLTALHVAHRAMLSDLRRLTELLPEAGAVSAARLSATRWYTRSLLSAIHHHVHGDEALWPLVARAAGDALDLSPYAGGHEALGPLMRRCRAAVDGDLACLGRELKPLLDLLAEQIAGEEAELFPIITERVPHAAWARAERRLAGQVPVRQMAFRVPWLDRHATGDETERILTGSGRASRVFLALTRPGYRRRERLAFG
ncbi:hemerythrin domain-containing protein [Nonomuraea sp. SMC257]|uniref:non-specific serine/threonine protein kinase n=1 Tax=Nonomuraea montanisoli TaxID=2741721 RepID=A0A7Y6IGG2_9ACTN|nr:protein kinase [Nonomuraea montanisoli]NUW36384.1 hemerythrin domain-containing protein [Nonomuraea montanisoli]